MFIIFLCDTHLFQNAGAKAACDALEVDYGTKYQHGNIADIICKFNKHGNK